MRRIIGIGETVLDLVFRNDRPVAAVPGGSTFNAMVSLGRTVPKRFPDIEILMFTEVGDDHVGDLITSFMKENHVGTEAVIRPKGSQSTLSLAFLDDRNDAAYEFYRSPAGKPEAAGELQFCSGDVVLFGSFFAIDPKLRSFTLPLLKAARKAGATVYYDVNFRKNHLADLPEVLAGIEENCRLSDFVRGSAEDFGYVYGTQDPLEIYRHVSPFCSNFICTCGAGPVHVFTEDSHMTFEVPQVETVSTIGAGDNFNAGFIYGLLCEKPGCANAGKEGRTSTFSAGQWQRLVAYATGFSSEACRSLDNYVGPDFCADIE